MDFNRKIDSASYGDSDLPLYPARTLAIHVAVKGLQFGSVAGVFAISPFASFYWKRPFFSTFRAVTPASTILGCAASLGLLYGKYLSGDLDSAEAVDDRAYRIYKNKGQNDVDKYSFIGFITGLSA